MRPRALISTDKEITDEAAHMIKERFNDWIVTGGPILFTGAIHLAIETPDGGWQRVCHHEGRDETTWIIPFGKEEEDSD